MNRYFENKVVVITGGGGGIGTALVDQLLVSNAKIAALDINLDALTPSENLLPVTLDITDKDLLVHAIAQIHDHFGRIDILINNAGVTHMRKFSDLSAELFDRVMAINFTASVDITRLCLPHLLKTRGQIVAVSSVAGFAPLYGRSAYSASKHAMQGFFGSLATELKDRGVSVTIISPSFVKSRPELQAKASADLLSPGATKKNTAGEQIAPDIAARLILKATRKRHAYVYLGNVSKIARWLFALFPGTYLKVMIKGAREEFALGRDEVD
jgi:NAD(P)-dependent dehydrogenase (short-subunit alcohol dehydrogenase family)